MIELTQKQTNILIVCTGNICRSPMAEGILHSMLKTVPDITVSSAGTHALIGNSATEFAVIAAKENGIDISRHKARLIEEKMINESSIIVCMESFHVENVLEIAVSAETKTFNLAHFSKGGKRLKKISDPYGCSLREYRECFQDIDVCIKNFMDSEQYHAIKG